MRINPISPIAFIGAKFSKKEQPQPEEGKKKGIEDIDPSFKYYMSTCQPIKPQVVFRGHWPQYQCDSLPPCDDVLGMPFPMTYKSYFPSNPDGGEPDIDVIISTIDYMA